MKSLFIFLVLVIGCGKDGRDGEPGKAGLRGAPGEKGADGINGINGIDGKNGNDNHVASKIYCSGDLTTTSVFNDTHIIWDSATMTSGDVYVAASAVNMGSFNVSGTAFYSVKQTGATTGAITLYPDDANSITIKYDILFKNVTVKIESTNGNGGTYTNTNACTSYTF